MIIGISVEDAHSTHITYKIAKTTTSKANFIGKDDSENVFYYCLNTQHESQDLWYVDSGRSSHMTGDKNSFVQLNKSIKSNITLDDGRIQEVASKWTIAMKAKNR